VAVCVTGSPKLCISIHTVYLPHTVLTMLARMHIIGALCLIWCTVAVLAEVKVPMQYGIPGYNIGGQQLETRLPVKKSL
jgi:hypothetical protein